MNKNKLLGWYKLGVALIVLGAVITQFMSAAQRPTFNPINFFSFFTIESNIFAAIIFAVSGVGKLRGTQSTHLDILRGAATIYMTITGIVYVALLSGLEESLQTPIPWVNITLHYTFPLIAFADWFIDRPRLQVAFKKALLWLVFPIVYLVYSLVRGAATGWYPYPFLNPASGGYGKVAITAVGISILAYLLCVGLVSITKMTKRG